MSNLLADLGLEFVDPTTISTGLKQLKPTDEAQIFSVILAIPGLENTTIKYARHNFYNQIKRNVRCSGGSCCLKARELHEQLANLPEGDERKRQKPLAQTRYILPVVVYQGKTAQAYGGPIEVRYIDIAGPTYSKWDAARAAVNEDIAPFYQRDFIMTNDPSIKGAPVMTHLESKAKWLTDPAINAEVRAIIQSPNFIQDYIKVVPPKMEDSDFLNAWNVAMNQPRTAAEQAVNAAQIAQQTIQPALTTQSIMTPVQNPQPVQPINPTSSPIDMNVINTPTVIAQAQQPAQPVNVVSVQQPVNPTPVQENVLVNTGLPTQQVGSGISSGPDVAFTPQNIINGSYSTGTVANVVPPEAVVNMQPVSIAPATVVEQAAAPVQSAAVDTSTAPTTSQSEITLANIGDLDNIIANLPQP